MKRILFVLPLLVALMLHAEEAGVLDSPRTIRRRWKAGIWVAEEEEDRGGWEWIHGKREKREGEGKRGWRIDRGRIAA